MHETSTNPLTLKERIKALQDAANASSSVGNHGAAMQGSSSTTAGTASTSTSSSTPNLATRIKINSISMEDQVDPLNAISSATLLTTSTTTACTPPIIKKSLSAPSKGPTSSLQSALIDETSTNGTTLDERNIIIPFASTTFSAGDAGPLPVEHNNFDVEARRTALIRSPANAITTPTLPPRPRFTTPSRSQTSSTSTASLSSSSTAATAAALVPSSSTPRLAVITTSDPLTSNVAPKKKVQAGENLMQFSPINDQVMAPRLTPRRSNTFASIDDSKTTTTTTTSSAMMPALPPRPTTSIGPKMQESSPNGTPSSLTSDDVKKKKKNGDLQRSSSNKRYDLLFDTLYKQFENPTSGSGTRSLQPKWIANQSRATKPSFNGNGSSMKNQRDDEELLEDRRISGSVIRCVWLKSRLEERFLRKIWSKCDTSNQGSLNREEFKKGLTMIDDELRTKRILV